MELVLTGKKIEFSPSCAEVFEKFLKSFWKVLYRGLKSSFIPVPNFYKGGGYDHLCCARNEQAVAGGATFYLI